MSLKKNVIANYLGNGWAAIMSLVFIPVYIKYLGMEAYGLIGFYSVLQTCLMLLDMGITPTLSREMARFTGGEHSSETIKDLLRSLEIICFSVATIYVLGIWYNAEWVAQNWLKTTKLPVSVVSEACTLMGFVTALRLIEGLYRGAIMGLQRQVIFNVVNTTMATLRGGGSVLVLVYIDASIKAYFIWQGTVSLLTVMTLAYLIYTSLPATKRYGKFSVHELIKVWRFAAGVMLNSLLALVLSQVDKIILSRILKLEEFGNYTLVTTVANGIAMISGPIIQAFYPRMAALKSQNNVLQLFQTFFRGSYLVTAVSGVATLSLFFSGNRILAIWTGNEQLATSVFELLRIMTVGTFFNGLIYTLYTLQLVYGWPGYTTKIHFIAALLILPAILLVAPLYGGTGTAWVWLAMNFACLLAHFYIVTSRILHITWKNYIIDTAIIPLTTTFAVLGTIKWLMPTSHASVILESTIIVSAAIAALTLSLLSSGDLRAQLSGMLRLHVESK